MATSELDIIVLTHGHLELTIQCVNALYQHTTSPFHLIVMDDSTPDMDDGTDLTPTWLARFSSSHENMTFVHSNEPYKSSLQLFKQAFEYCETPYVGIVMNSLIVEPEWDVMGLQIMKSNPQVGMVGFKCIRQGTEMIESAGLAVKTGGDMLMDMGRGQIGHRLTKIYECDAVQWAFALLRLEAVKDNLGEDVYNGFKGMEDFETCYTMREKGWKIFYCGLGVGYHQTLATRIAKTPEDIVENFENREIFAKRWGFWKDYQKLYPGLGEFFPDMEVRARTVSPLLMIDPVGKVTQALDLKENITPQEEEAIKSLVSGVARKGATFVEVGSWKGHSASIIGNVAKQSDGHLFCVDHWKGNEGTWNVAEAQRKDIYKIFEYNLQTLGLWDSITPMKMDSIKASKQFPDASIDFLFLDCDHRHKQFKGDLEAWLPKVKLGGIICGHDCEQYYTKISPRLQKMVDSHLVEDYIKTENLHPGVVKGLYDYFQDNYNIVKDTRIWFKKNTNSCKEKSGVLVENFAHSANVPL